MFCEEIDLGEGAPRKVASGLRSFYTADQLLGKLVVVLSNLKERNLAGFPSHGMVLCGDQDGKIVICEPPENAVVGELLKCEISGEPKPDEEIKTGKKNLPWDKVMPDLKVEVKIT